MDKISHLFKSLESRELPKDLKPAIFLAIQKEKRKWILIDLVVSGTASVVSLIAVVLASIYTFSAFAQAGFFEYVSLLLSERTAALSYWKEIGLTIAEALPVFSLTILLATFLALVWFAGRATRDTRNILLPA